MERQSPSRKVVPNQSCIWWNFTRRRTCYVWIKRKHPVLRLPAICPNEHGHKWPVQIVRTEMELPPLGGAVFIFFSKNRQQVKMLKWDATVSCCIRSDWSEEPLNYHSLIPKAKQCKMPYKTLSAIMSGICLKVWDIGNGLIYRRIRLYLMNCVSIR